MNRIDSDQYPVWLNADMFGIEEFKAQQQRQTTKDDCPLATDIHANVPIYDGAALSDPQLPEATWRSIMAEWNRVMRSGAGIIAIKGAIGDIEMLDKVTDVLNRIIRQEEAAGDGPSDHFAELGANSRLWNSHEKLCQEATELFIRYNANEVLHRASEAWLGYGYQITAQTNIVRPGGKAQTAHRDFHMGIQPEEILERYPADQHQVAAHLTLQGAVAHTDMPIESGPTKLLPFSQTFVPGYISILHSEFRDYFEENYIQMPLQKGDMLFFNPSVFHAAGDNVTTDMQRFANLIQVNSAYGRPMEIVDRARICKKVFPLLLGMKGDGLLTDREIENVLAASADAYPFPINLDLDSPKGELAPPSQRAVMRRALDEHWSPAEFAADLDGQVSRRRSH
ncbi:phytanoyl-CoA dioxygenase family protein [Hoeflea prorocentri]|uniref:Phytanoyl-CoA dioxygenase family protein n=1 Tax=Hoeflea prorocentri TaxID=1922333 RepID=A0A9X3UF91_9HYPH|nr:phytanoyl-CoA dioxygenase family protein [Hoeflea prorocentri]MCY6379748.1 phytanoyl-CoA dioxygenase family protein [Hoeflea prorocentri]MDA5397548.1 phytanoyl-CoA dioxygenase family protein [Hoeflea prorocentri]